MRSPIVSIVVTAYNAGCFLPETLESVFSQSYSNYEIIVVDDGSTDGTREALQPYAGRISYLYQQNLGPSAARNTGIRAALGNYVALLDGDDLWNRDKLKLQVDFMEQNPQIGLVFSDMEEFDHEKILCRSLLGTSLFASEMLSPGLVSDAARKLLAEDFVPTSTVLIRKECLAKTGLFDENLDFAEDRELWLRVAAAFPIAVLPVVLGRKRNHDSNLTKKSSEETLRARVRIWEKARRSFSDPSTASLLDALLANAHLALGYILWGKDQRKQARRIGLRSINYALKHIAGRDCGASSVADYQWSLGIVLIPLTFVKWSLARSLWRARKYLFKKRISSAGCDR